VEFITNMKKVINKNKRKQEICYGTKIKNMCVVLF
jgi:hypothetical protein